MSDCSHCEDGIIWHGEQPTACPFCLVQRLRSPTDGWSGDASAVSDITAAAAADEIERLSRALTSAFNAGVEAAAEYHASEVRYHQNTPASSGTGMANRHAYYAERIRERLKPSENGFSGFEIDEHRRAEFARLMTKHIYESLTRRKPDDSAEMQRLYLFISGCLSHGMLALEPERERAA